MSQTATAPLLDSAAAGGVETTAPARPAIIDCDLHNEIDSLKDLYPYLSQRWRDHLDTFGLRTPNGGYYPRFMGHREDARPAVGAYVRVRGGVHPPPLPRSLSRRLRGPQSGGAGQRGARPGVGRRPGAGHQRLQVAEWLDRDARLRASIMLAPETRSRPSPRYAAARAMAGSCRCCSRAATRSRWAAAGTGRSSKHARRRGCTWPPTRSAPTVTP